MLAVCRLSRRLFLCLLIIAVPVAGQSIPMTTVQDTVYRADSSPAQGTLLISWPAFTTSSGTAIGAGSTSVKLSAGGVFSVALVPNVNATPAATVYTVVYQLDPLS
jgi:trimeric autotransporter adhesin